MNDAFDLVCENLQETPTNNKAVFAKWKRGLPLGSFTSALMTAWEHADGENQRRLAMAFPQIASAILEWQTLANVSEKRAEKYLDKLLGVKK